MTRDQGSGLLGAALAHGADEGLLLLDGTRVLAANPAAHEALGLPDRTLLGSDLSVLLANRAVIDDGLPTLAQLCTAAPVPRFKCDYHHPCGSVRSLWASSRPVGIEGRTYTAVTLVDATTAYLALHELSAAAAEDPLTGLPNRAQLEDHLRAALGRSRHAGQAAAAVFFIDLDGFKVVNDTYGHAVGDRVLVAIARRLQFGIQRSDERMRSVFVNGTVVVHLCRYAGDEFVAVAEGIHDPAAACILAERIVSLASRPVVLPHGESVEVGACVGVAFTRPDRSPAEVMVAADTALYGAKSLGSGHVVTEALSPSYEHSAIAR